MFNGVFVEVSRILRVLICVYKGFVFAFKEMKCWVVFRNSCALCYSTKITLN